jgi:sulfite exporter TauE/SafE
MIELIAGAGVAGLIGSIHCLGMCGSFAVACGGTVRESLFWHAGRLTTYMVLGALLGAFGGSIPGPGWIAGVISTLLIVYFAAVLAGLLPEPQVSIPGVQKAASKLISRPEAGARYLFGLVNGLLPCGLVYATLAVPVALGDPTTGAAAMLLFGLGTVPALATVTFGLRKFAFRDMRLRRLLALGVLVAGLWSIGMRQGVLGSGHGMQHGMEEGDAPAMDHTQHEAPPDSE